jgi:histidyl-tRNA synthetase
LVKKTGEKNLLNKGFSSEVVQKILAFAEISGNNDEILDKVENIVGDITTELREVIHALRSMKIDEKRFKVDLSIARGLDYYTGTVYETSLVGYENLGSICSGGRYDDLAEIFTGKKLPGVGISIGLTRLLSQFFDGGLVEVDRSSPSQFLVIAASQNAKSKCLEIATHVRDLGYRVENYLEDKKIRKQFDYADKLGIPYVLIMGEDELEKNIIQLKNMKSGKQTEINLSDIEHILEDVVG